MTAGGLISLSDAKSQLGLPSAVTQYDADLQIYVNAATPIIEFRTGAILQHTQTFTFDGGRGSVLLPRFQSVTSMTIGGVAAVAGTDYVANGAQGIIYGGTSTGPSDFADGLQSIVVTVVLGTVSTDLSQVPYNAQLATRELVRHWWQSGRQANRPGTAEEIAAQPLPLGVSNRIDELLQPIRNVAGFA